MWSSTYLRSENSPDLIHSHLNCSISEEKTFWCRIFSVEESATDFSMLFHCLITHIVCCCFFPPETESAKSHPAAFLISWRFTLQRGIAFCCQMSFSLLKGRSNYNNPVCLPAPVLGTQTPAAALAVGAQAGGSRQGHRARGCTELVLGTSTSSGKGTWWEGTHLAWGRRMSKFCSWGEFVQSCFTQSTYTEVKRTVGGAWQCVVEVVSLGLLRGLQGLQYLSA